MYQYRSITPAKRAKIIAALRADPHARTVADPVGRRIGVSYGSFWNIAKAEGIKLRKEIPARWRKAAERRAKIAALLEINPHGKEVARQLGISRGLVYVAAQKEGIELTASRDARRRVHAEIATALKANPRPVQVARELGIPYRTVARVAHHMGCKTPWHCRQGKRKV